MANRVGVVIAVCLVLGLGASATAETAETARTTHLEFATVTFDLDPGETAHGSKSCQFGMLMSGGYNWDQLSGHENVRVIANAPQPQGRRKGWRVDVRNSSDSRQRGRYNIVVLCSGPPRMAQVFSGGAKSTVGYLYFERYVHTALDLNGRPVDVFDMFRIRPDGSGLTRLTTAPPNQEHDSFGGAISPDGTSMAFSTFRHRDGTTGRNSAELYVAAADGSGAQRLTDNVLGDDYPAWCAVAPARIIWSRDGEIVWALADGSDMQPVVGTGAYEFDVDCSEDGSKIAFVRTETDNQRQIYLADVDGSNEMPLGGDAFLNWAPAFSPDGQWLVFAADRKATPDGHTELYLMRTADADGDETGDDLRQLTFATPGPGAGGPVWSPDGASILFHADHGSGSRLFVLDVATGIVSPPVPGVDATAFAADWR